ncbi:MAG: YfhO family protein [Acidobacteriia bacterium]|nr:YfhO family protein [Terriglobia bacterium]
MKRLSLRVPLTERRVVAILAILLTCAFFYEYLPPFKRVHVFSDIEGFHYPLQRYAFQTLKEGRFPQWDPSIYCGISFVGNVQAAVLYPPAWLMYAASWRYPRLPFKALEGFAFAHIWLGFLLCWLWLRGRRLGRLASALGAASFACGGYMVSQIVHLGVVTAMAWMPLGLWGIDEAVERRDWRPLWKTALASALCFLAGYPASWLVFCATNFLYALASRAHWRAAAGVCAALAASMLLAMVQLLPVLEASHLMYHDDKYGGGVVDWKVLIALFVPNWFDFNLGTKAPYPEVIPLYWGLATMFVIAWAVSRHNVRPYTQALVVLAPCFFLATNPHNWAYQVVKHFPFLERVLTSWNFYEGIAAMAALVTAIGVHDFLERAPRRPAPRWALPAVMAALLAWSVRQVGLWRHGGSFPTGGRALAETAAALALFSIALWTVRAESGARRGRLAAVLLLSVLVDYKVFETSRRFNTIQGDVDRLRASYGIMGMNHTAYRAIEANRDYRVASAAAGAPNATDFRKWGLAGPHGFDPFLPRQYRDLIERWVEFRTNREFTVDVTNEAMLQSLGVRYVIAHEGVACDPYLAASPNFRLVGPDDSFYRVYEYLHAKAPFGWEDGEGDAEPTGWMPERRAFHVRSRRGGRFFLVEQFYPGWGAAVDGRPVAVERWNASFQAIRAGAGEHDVVFAYHARRLPLGVAISLAAFAGLIAVILSDQRRREHPPKFWLEIRAGLAARLTASSRSPDRLRPTSTAR